MTYLFGASRSWEMIERCSVRLPSVAARHSFSSVRSSSTFDVDISIAWMNAMAVPPSPAAGQVAVTGRARSPTRFEDDVHRRLGRPPEHREPGLLEDLAQP